MQNDLIYKMFLYSKIVVIYKMLLKSTKFTKSVLAKFPKSGPCDVLISLIYNILISDYCIFIK